MWVSHHRIYEVTLNSPCTVLVYNIYPMIYPRTAAGLEYKNKVSHCPQGREAEKKGGISLDAIGKSWTELEGGMVCRTILGLSEKHRKKIQMTFWLLISIPKGKANVF